MHVHGCSSNNSRHVWSDIVHLALHRHPQVVFCAVLCELFSRDLRGKNNKKRRVT
jgi:hypothetical protein